MDATDELHDLACGLDRRVNHYASCIIEGMRFHIRKLEMQRWIQNSRIATTGYERKKEIDYYDVLVDIIKLKYESSNFVFYFSVNGGILVIKRSVFISIYNLSV